MRVLGIDLGKQMGFGLLGGAAVLSGSREVVKKWAPFGPSWLILEGRLQELIDQHKPDILGVARPFVRRGRGGAMVDTPQNLVPMFGQFAIFHRTAAVNRLRVEEFEESDARSIMLGKFMPGRSEPLKAAIIQACRDRGWPCCDDHAGDALCIAAAVLERLNPGQAHQTTPLFTVSATKTRRQRRQRAA